MSRQPRIAAVAATLALAGASLVGVASQASATPAPALYGCTYKNVQGSLGHLGAAVTCKGGSNDWFYGSIDCKRFDNGYVYHHVGPTVRAGQTSTVWCDLNAKVIGVFHTEA
ncbi:hypothetical protein ACFVFS_28190 [Kitasatospora sp. NPDC057692]|uniref:hypothetical protein n=1 Tax=Kitasatospora sp. NPDC057692 TaxID=3346215 RepID=UPI00367E59A4